MNLVIDSGNSAAKVGIFDHENLVEKLTFASMDDLRAFVRATDDASATPILAPGVWNGGLAPADSEAPSPKDAANR